MNIKRYIAVLSASLAAGLSTKAQEWVTLSITNGAMCSVLEVPEGTAVELVTMRFFPQTPIGEIDKYWILNPGVHFYTCSAFTPWLNPGDSIVGPIKLYLNGEPTSLQAYRLAFATFKLHQFKKNASLITEGSADLKTWTPLATNQVQLTGTNNFFRTRIEPAK